MPKRVQQRELLVKFLRWCVTFCATLLLLAALLVSALRFWLPHLEQDRARFESWASSALHQPVQIQSVQVYWHRFTPMIAFQGIVVGPSDPT